MKTLLSVLMLIVLCITINGQWQSITNSYLSQGFGGNKIEAVGSDFLIVSAAVNSANRLMKTLDNGTSWTEIVLPLQVSERVINVSAPDNSHFWVATSRGRILCSNDNGVSWSAQFTSSNISPFVNYMKMFDLNNGIFNIDFMVGTSVVTAFFRTSDGGINWNKITNDADFTNCFSFNDWREIQFLDSQTGYFYATGTNPVFAKKLLKTTNGGTSWTPLNLPNNSSVIWSLRFYNNDIGIVAGNNSPTQNCFFFTTDGGLNWETLTTSRSTNCFDIEYVPGNSNKLWMTDHVNLYYSNNGGRSWNQQNVGVSPVHGVDVAITTLNSMWLLTDDNIYFTQNTDGVTGVDEETDAIVAYELFSNYPNPFNPGTVISYRLPQSGKVTLKIYDPVGNEVATLVNQEQAAGTHKVSFDAGHLSSGVYICRIIAGNFVKTIKMSLVK